MQRPRRPDRPWPRHPTWPDRQRTRAEDRIRAARATGLRNLPLHRTTQNRIWLEIVQIALDLPVWMPMLALTSKTTLGRHPLGLMIGGALVFDHHTHLRPDMAPVLGRPVPSTDADRMRAVLTWVIAVLSNQVEKAPVAGLDARVALTLTGPGGGTWWFDEAGGLAPSDGPVAAHVTAPAPAFPDWGTQRSSWRDRDVTVTDDTELAARFLDTVNVI